MGIPWGKATPAPEYGQAVKPQGFLKRASRTHWNRVKVHGGDREVKKLLGLPLGYIHHKEVSIPEVFPNWPIQACPNNVLTTAVTLQPELCILKKMNCVKSFVYLDYAY